MRRRVQFEFSEPVRLGRLGIAAAQKGVRARHEFADAKRLGDVIVRPEVQAENDVFLLALGREHDDGRLDAALAHRAADLVAVHFGEHDIEQYQVVIARKRQREAALSLRGGIDHAAARDEVVLQPAEQRRIVFDNQDTAAGHAGVPRATVKVLPFPGWLETRTVPPCASTRNRTMASPSPQPPPLRDRRRSAW